MTTQYFSTIVKFNFDILCVIHEQTKLIFMHARTNQANLLLLFW